MNQKDEKLIANSKDINEVYMAINPNTFPEVDDYEVLYANKFVQEETKKMVPELAALFNNEGIKLNNPNLREQISRIMNQYDSESGPWYIDGDDSVINIHNGVNGPDSGFVFKYQEEFGEVLKVKISKKEVRGGTALKAMQQPDYNKEQTQVVIEPIKNTSELGLKSPILMTNRADSVRDNTRNDSNRYVNVLPLNLTDPEYNEKLLQSVNRQIAEYRASINYVDRYDNPSQYKAEDKANKEKLFSNYDPVTYKQALEAIETAHKRFSDGEEYTGRILWDDFQKRGDEAFEDNEMDRYKYAKEHTHFMDTPGVEYTNAYKPTNTQWANSVNQYRGIQNYESLGLGANIPISLKNGTIKVSSDMVAEAYTKATGKEARLGITMTIYQDMKNVQDKWIAQGYNVVGLTLKYDPQTGCNYVVPDLRKTEERTTYSTYDAMHYVVDNNKQPNLHNAFSTAMASMNAMRNNLRRAKHKELSVELLVVGRPQLKAGIVITLLGIGNKYSGKWYVKTCIHQMDKTGYTCSLTLQKNQLTAPGAKAKTTTQKKDSGGNIVNRGGNVINLSRADTVILLQNNKEIREINKLEKPTDKDIARRRDLVDSSQAIIDEAIRGGSTSHWDKDKGVVVDTEKLEKNKKALIEARKKRQEAEKQKAKAMGDMKKSYEKIKK